MRRFFENSKKFLVLFAKLLVILIILNFIPIKFAVRISSDAVFDDNVFYAFSDEPNTETVWVTERNGQQEYLAIEKNDPFSILRSEVFIEPYGSFLNDLGEKTQGDEDTGGRFCCVKELESLLTMK